MSRLAAACLVIFASASVALADARTDCYEKSGAAAIRACTEAIRRNPEDVVSYVNRGFEYLQNGDYPRSLADYSKAIELDPDRLDALQGRAWTFLRMGKPDQGLADIQRFLEVRPDDARALDTRGHIYEALGRRQDAIADFRRALAIEPRMQGSREGLRRLGAMP